MVIAVGLIFFVAGVILVTFVGITGIGYLVMVAGIIVAAAGGIRSFINRA